MWGQLHKLQRVVLQVSHQFVFFIHKELNKKQLIITKQGHEETKETKNIQRRETGRKKTQPNIKIRVRDHDRLSVIWHCHLSFFCGRKVAKDF